MTSITKYGSTASKPGKPGQPILKSVAHPKLRPRQWYLPKGKSSSVPLAKVKKVAASEKKATVAGRTPVAHTGAGRVILLLVVLALVLHFSGK